MRYTPFNKEHKDISGSDLAALRDVKEGWYVEYKSQLTSTRDIAKTLSSFANQYGGWLFIGVDENPDSETAEHFPGIENEKVPEVLESLRNAAKDVVRPQVSYLSQTVEGPVETIELNSDRSIVVVHIPEGSNTPYIHNDGRIYIRIGDSSSPIPATDKATFDLLYRRGEDRRSYLKALIERSPELSEEEEQSSFIHLSILSDPYETLGHWYEGTYSDFTDIMTGSIIPFDNIYTAPDGFIARQARTNDRYHRLLTWEFSRNCNSFVTIPISVLPSIASDIMDPVTNLNAKWAHYSIGAEFRAALAFNGLEDARILNLNLLLSLIGVIIARHRTIVGQANIKGPFFIKARIENVWRTIPFIDVKDYLAHVKRYDFPVVQDSAMIVPLGTSLETFVISPELDDTPSELEKIRYDGPIVTWIHIMEALGIPGELLQRSANDLLNASIRESEIHRSRISSG